MRSDAGDTPGRVYLGAPAEWAPGVRMTDFLDSDGPVRAEGFDLIRAASKSRGRPLPLLFPNQRHGLRTDRFGADASEEWRQAELKIHRDRTARLTDIAKDDGRANLGDPTVSAEYAGGVIDDEAHDFTSRFLFAFWRLCQQRMPAITRYRDEPGTAGASPRIADTRIVRLRGWDSSTSDHQKPGAGTHYRHRWVVRMHKVRQWYPSEGVHKILWRGPYIKGPDGAPLLDGDKIHALVR